MPIVPGHVISRVCLYVLRHKSVTSELQHGQYSVENIFQSSTHNDVLLL